MSRRAALEQARTLLFVPGDRPDRFERAASAGADLVILDLEDAVAPDRKDQSRAHVRDYVARHPGAAAVRINGAGTPWHRDDLAELAELAELAGVRNGFSAIMVPKAQDPQEVAAIVRWAASTPVIALVETARGVLAAAAVAGAGVARLAFGSFDLAAELAVSPDDRPAMAAARGALVLASAAAGLAAPVDAVTGDVRDEQALREDTEHARRLGFTGKLCIHPGQVPTVADLLAPTRAELEWAADLVSVAESAGAVLVHQGRMVDKPVLDRARRLLAGAFGGAAGGAR